MQKLKQESEHEFLQQEEALRAALQVRADEKAKNTTTISTKVVDPEGRKRRVNHNYGNRFGQPSAAARADNARGAIDRIKRQTQEARMRRNASLRTPTHMLQNRSSGVRKAPAGMIVEHELQQRQQMPLQRLQQQDHKPDKKMAEAKVKAMIPPRRGSVLQLQKSHELRKQCKQSGVSAIASERADTADLTSREERLKALKDGANVMSPAKNNSTAAKLGSAVEQLHKVKQNGHKSNAQEQSPPGSNHLSSASPPKALIPQSSSPNPLRPLISNSSPSRSQQTMVPKLKRKRQVNPLMPMKRTAR